MILPGTELGSQETKQKYEKNIRMESYILIVYLEGTNKYSNWATFSTLFVLFTTVAGELVGVLGGPGRVPSGSGTLPGALREPKVAPGPILEPFGVDFGSILDRFWTDFGPILDRFGVDFGSIFGRFLVDV